MVQDNGNNFSLFRPHSEFSRRNRNIILSMLVIWAMAVFGFQILLKVIEKPTPEKSYLTFERIWPLALSNEADLVQRQDIAKSLVLVAGKTSMRPLDRAVLDSALTVIIYDIAADSVAPLVNAAVSVQKEAMSRLAKAGDKEYLEIQATVKETKASISQLLCPLLDIPNDGLEATLLPFHLLPDVYAISEGLQSEVERVMTRYTIHNQSVLTDTPFLGFPFHYFYTAVFLLIFFVLLCYLYCVRIERLQKRFGIDE